MNTIFRDRTDAGQRLATRLTTYTRRADTLVLGLPRGGVPVAYEVARTLDLPLDLYVVRKLGVPGRAELAMGAIASGGVRVLNDTLISSLGITSEQVAAVTAQETAELARRELAYRGGRPPVAIHGRTVLLIDDGMATGATMFAAIAALRQQDPMRIVVAVPVAAAATCQQVGALVDEVVCAFVPESFYAVGLWYDDFEQAEDATMLALLDQRACELRIDPAGGVAGGSAANEFHPAPRDEPPPLDPSAPSGSSDGART
jgi:predicted phosphoribosyltransferase